MTSTDILYQSTTKRQQNHLMNPTSPSRLEFSRSSTKRIYESVFRIIDFDQIEAYQDQDKQENQGMGNVTNSAKFNELVNDENLLTFLYQKMKTQGILDNYPILKVCCQQMNSSKNLNNNIFLNYEDLYFLELSDIVSVFEKFGDLNKIILSQDSKFAFVFFNTFHSAYMSSKLLNGQEFFNGTAKLHINWIDQSDYQYLMPNNMGLYLNSINWHLMYKYCSSNANNYKSNSSNMDEYSNQNNMNNNQKQNKLTCRYDIQIENQRDFQVARRIIGSKGCNMKKIIQDCIDQAKTTQFFKNNPKHFDNVNQLLKLRLRGRGSGYKEGPDHQQSDQSLHLCVSAKDQICYQFACQKVQKLLESVYQQYYQYTLEQDGRGIQLEVTKNSYITSSNNGDQPSLSRSSSLYQSQSQNIEYSQPSVYSPSFYYTQQQLNSMHITPHKICQLLEMRNKARRQLNFIQADRIRNFLRNCGVCLIDQKGRRGRAMEVTTWKYIF